VETSVHDLCKRRFHFAPHVVERRRRVLQDRTDGGDQGISMEGPVSGEHFVEHGAKEKMSLRASTGFPSACSGDM